MYGTEDGLALVKDLFMQFKLAEIFKIFFIIFLFKIDQLVTAFSMTLGTIYSIFSNLSAVTHWVRFWAFFFRLFEINPC